MAKEASSIFNQSARERLRNPDDLDRCVRVTTPSVWVMLSAVILLILGFLAWGVFGVTTVDIEDACICKGDKLICFFDEQQAKLIKVGDSVDVEGNSATVTYVADHPMSHEEVMEVFEEEDYVDMLMEDGTNYAVYISGGKEYKEGMAYYVIITTKEASPISLVFG